MDLVYYITSDRSRFLHIMQISSGYSIINQFDLPGGIIVRAANPTLGEPLIFIYDADAGRIVKTDIYSRILRYFVVNRLVSFQVSPDGRRLAVGTSTDSTMQYISVYDITDNRFDILFGIDLTGVIAFRGFTLRPDTGHYYVPIGLNNTVNEYSEDGLFVASHIVDLPDFNVESIAVDGLGTLGMIDCNFGRVYFQPVTTSVAPANYSYEPSSHPCSETIAAYGRNSFIVHGSSRRLDFYTTTPPVSSSSSVPPSSSSSSLMTSSSGSNKPSGPVLDYKLDRFGCIMPQSFLLYSRFAMSRDPSQPHRLFFVSRGVTPAHAITSLDWSTGLALPDLHVTVASLERCNINESLNIHNIVPRRTSIMLYHMARQPVILEVDLWNGDCLRSWHLTNFTDTRVVIDSFALDDTNQRFVVITHVLPQIHDVILSLISMGSGDVIASVVSEMDTIIFDSHSGDYFAHGTSGNGFLRQLSGTNLSTMRIITGQDATRGYLVDQFGTLLTAIGGELGYVYSNNLYNSIESASDVWWGNLAFTLSGDVAAVKCTTTENGCSVVLVTSYNASQPAVPSSSSSTASSSSTSWTHSSSRISSSSTPSSSSTLSSSSQLTSILSRHSFSSSQPASSSNLPSSASILSSSQPTTSSVSSSLPCSSSSSTDVPFSSIIAESSSSSTWSGRGSSVAGSSAGDRVSSMISTTSISSSGATSNVEGASSQQLSDATIAGIVIAVLATVAIVSAGLILFFRCRYGRISQSALFDQKFMQSECENTSATYEQELVAIYRSNP